MDSAEHSLDSLSEKALSGDSDAEKELFKSLRVRFLIIAKHRVHADHAEDLVQDTLRIVFDRYSERNEGQGILVWGLTVLRNVIGNYYQTMDREKNRLSFVDELPADAACQNDFFADIEQSQLMNNLLEAIASLAERFPRCGTIFHHLLASLDDGGSPNEISTRCLKLVQKDNPDLNRGSFYTALHRCRAQLKGLLAQIAKGTNHD